MDTVARTHNKSMCNSRAGHWNPEYPGIPNIRIFSGNASRHRIIIVR